MPIYYHIALVIIGIFVLLQAGRYVVRSLSAMARFLHVSEFVLSFILIAFATSLPELAVGINAALSGIPALSLGDIVGTNIVNFTLILGAVATIGGKIELRDHKHFKENRVFHFLLVMAPLMLLLDGTLSRIDGGFLLVLFMGNLFKLLDVTDFITGKKVFRPHLEPHTTHTAASKKHFLGNIIVFIAGVSTLLGSASLVVWSIRNITHSLGVSEILVGLFVIGIGTSLPELSIGIRSVISKHGGVSLGDIFGSSVINSTLVLGIVALISPITLQAQPVFWVTVAFVAATMLLANFFLRNKSYILRKEGIILLSMYALFISVQILFYAFNT